MSGAWAAGVLGQGDALRTLDGLLRRAGQGRFVMLQGPRGVGKASTAQRLAVALGCTAESAPLQPCGSCPVCRGGLEHPDLVSLVPEKAGGTIKVDDVRESATQAAYPPLVARHRVWVVNPLERLTGGAANALLRLLEEPPSRLWVIGVTHNPSAVPITLRSRAYKVPFRTLDAATLQAILGVEDPVSQGAGTVERAGLVADAGFRRLQEAWQALLGARIYDPTGPVDFVKQLGAYPDGLRGFWVGLLAAGAVRATVADAGGNSYNDAFRSQLAGELDERAVLLAAIDALEAHVNPSFVCEDAVRRIRQIRKELRT